MHSKFWLEILNGRRCWKAVMRASCSACSNITVCIANICIAHRNILIFTSRNFSNFTLVRHTYVEDNIKIDVWEIGWACVDLYGSL
jgi:hypothetical protein